MYRRLVHDLTCIPVRFRRLHQNDSISAPAGEEAASQNLCNSIYGSLGQLQNNFDEQSATVNGFVEIPSGTKVKYEIDRETGILMVDRVLFSSVVYPMNYGFIPRTGQADGDELDILIYSQDPFAPGTFSEARIVGVLKMIDTGEQDDKIIAVAATDPMFSSVDKLEDLGQHTLGELKRFFEDYKRGEEGKSVDVEGFGGKDEAVSLVMQAVEEYKRAC